MKVDQRPWPLPAAHIVYKEGQPIRALIQEAKSYKGLWEGWVKIAENVESQKQNRY
jgi:hypothetical protein